MSLEVTIRRSERYVHITAETQLVDRCFLDDLIDAIENGLPDIPERSYRLLLEVRAPEVRLDLIAAFEAWRRALAKGLAHTKIAYVVHGRPIHAIARLIETFAETQRVHLRFFGDNASALSWLCPESARTPSAAQ